MNKKKILFIAKNIPIPDRQSGNKIIYTIADKVSEFCDVTFFFPKSRVPWGLHFLKKHKPLYKLRDWSYGGHQVNVIPFIQMPGLFATYWLFNRLPHKARVLFEKNKFELIHAHYGMPDGYLAYKLSKRFNVPYIVTLRTHDLRYLSKVEKWNPDCIKYSRVLDNAQKVVVTNAYLRDFCKGLGIESDVVPHGIEAVPPFVENDSLSVRIVCVSEYITRKNIEWVIDAVLSYDGVVDVSLELLGDMDAMPDLYKKKCRGSIKYRGKVSYDTVLKTLGDSSIFVLPSVLETFGLVYLEAAATGNAIIGHKDEGVCGVFEDEKEMLFASNYNDFRDKLYDLIENPEKRKQLSQNAYVKSKQLTWENVVKKYKQLYACAIGECK